MPSRLRLKEFDDHLSNLKWTKEQNESRMKKAAEAIKWYQDQSDDFDAANVKIEREMSEVEVAKRQYLRDKGI